MRYHVIQVWCSPLERRKKKQIPPEKQGKIIDSLERDEIINIKLLWVIKTLLSDLIPKYSLVYVCFFIKSNKNRQQQPMSVETWCSKTWNNLRLLFQNAIIALRWDNILLIFQIQNWITNLKFIASFWSAALHFLFHYEVALIAVVCWLVFRWFYDGDDDDDVERDTQ